MRRHTTTRVGSRRHRVALTVAVSLTLLAGCSGDDGSATTPPGTTGVPGSTAPSSTAAPTTTTPEPAPDLDRVDIALREVGRAESPTSLFARPGTDQVWVTERTGRIIGFRVTAGGLAKLPEPVLDMVDEVGSDGLEQGLLGGAFTPDGSSLVISYTNPDGDSRVDVVPVTGDKADPASARQLLAIDQPHDNHNGGSVAFGPDGMLYLGFGDGGSQGDPDDNGQNPHTLLATLLRIDPQPDGGQAYTIPTDNPFADGRNGRPEVWAYGLRNPWRFSFDRSTGDLWIGDVGGSEREEIDLAPATAGRDAGKGLNFGWSLREGRADTDKRGNRSGLTEPVLDVGHDDGVCSIVGGYVYRGSAIASLRGVYLWSDWCDSTLRATVAVDGSAEQTRRLDGVKGEQITSFGEDTSGELYVLELGGAIKLVTG